MHKGEAEGAEEVEGEEDMEIYFLGGESSFYDLKEQSKSAQRALWLEIQKKQMLKATRPVR